MSPPVDSMTADGRSYAPAMPVVADWRDYLALLKPRVMSLVVFTGLCGLLLAPVPVHPAIGFAAILCLAAGAGAAGALNQWYEADIDALMERTKGRPLPSGRIGKDDALGFALTLAAGSVITMGVMVNWISAAVLLGSILFYVLIYTVWLKRRTPQNIVIGGAAGAFPPVIGWAAATGEIGLLPLLLFGVIFLWTPPHFWALALVVNSDYGKAGVPMLPVVAGEAETRRQILLYSLLLTAFSLLPWALGLTGAIYGIGAAVLGALFLAGAVAVWRNRQPGHAWRLFGFSILYLFALFALAVGDKFA